HGMFALAIWDRAARRLVLARDRIGIKPLFYASGSRGFGFASEIKALVAAGLTECRVDPGALRHYLSCGYVPRTDTIYPDVQRGPAAHFLGDVPRGSSLRRGAFQSAGGETDRQHTHRDSPDPHGYSLRPGAGSRLSRRAVRRSVAPAVLRDRTRGAPAREGGS